MGNLRQKYTSEEWDKLTSVKVETDPGFKLKDKNVMRIYQLKTAEEFYEDIKYNYSVVEIMQMYARDVATRFAAECINKALGNKMEVSNALHSKVEHMYNSIEW